MRIGMSAAFRAAGNMTNVIVYAGDGGTVDIGIQALSGALERELTSCTFAMTMKRMEIPECKGLVRRPPEH